MSLNSVEELGAKSSVILIGGDRSALAQFRVVFNILFGPAFVEETFDF